MVYPQYWSCPSCKAVVSNSQHCTNCAYAPPVQQPRPAVQPQPQQPQQGYPSYWTCPKCNTTVSASPACTTCQHNPSVKTAPVKNSPNLMNNKMVLYGGVAGIVILGAVLVFMFTSGGDSTLVNPEDAFNFSDNVIEEGEIDFLVQQQNEEKRDLLKECNPDWVCEEWSVCDEDDIVQKRECIDNSECGTHFYKPMTMRMCKGAEIPKSDDLN